MPPYGAPSDNPKLYSGRPPASHSCAVCLLTIELNTSPAFAFARPGIIGGYRMSNVETGETIAPGGWFTSRGWQLMEQAWRAWHTESECRDYHDERDAFVLDESLAGMCVTHLSSEDALVALDYWRVRTIQSVDEIVQRAKAEVAAKAGA